VGGSGAGGPAGPPTDGERPPAGPPPPPPDPPAASAECGMDRERAPAAAVSWGSRRCSIPCERSDHPNVCALANLIHFLAGELGIALPEQLGANRRAHLLVAASELGAVGVIVALHLVVTYPGFETHLAVDDFLGPQPARENGGELLLISFVPGEKLRQLRLRREFGLEVGQSGSHLALLEV